MKKSEGKKALNDPEELRRQAREMVAQMQKMLEDDEEWQRKLRRMRCSEKGSKLEEKGS